MSRNSCGDTVWIYERSLFVSLHGRLVRFRVSSILLIPTWADEITPRSVV